MVDLLDRLTGDRVDPVPSPGRIFRSPGSGGTQEFQHVKSSKNPWEWRAFPNRTIISTYTILLGYFLVMDIYFLPDFGTQLARVETWVCRQRSRSLIQSDVLCKFYVDPESDLVISPYENPLYVLTQALPRFPLSAEFGGLSPITIL